VTSGYHNISNSTYIQVIKSLIVVSYVHVLWLMKKTPSEMPCKIPSITVHDALVNNPQLSIIGIEDSHIHNTLKFPSNNFLTLTKRAHDYQAGVWTHKKLLLCVVS